MNSLLAIDPGPSASAWVLADRKTRRPLAFAKETNAQVLRRCYGYGTIPIAPAAAYLEMVASYGMAVGREVFETCVWIGRFREALEQSVDAEPVLTYRRDVKLHHCGQARAKDSNVRQALVDRFAPGAPNHGKGTKSEPGWFHGFAADVWQAYALAVYAADRLEGYQP